MQKYSYAIVCPSIFLLFPILLPWPSPLMIVAPFSREHPASCVMFPVGMSNGESGRSSLVNEILGFRQSFRHNFNLAIQRDLRSFCQSIWTMGRMA